MSTIGLASARPAVDDLHVAAAQVEDPAAGHGDLRRLGFAVDDERVDREQDRRARRRPRSAIFQPLPMAAVTLAAETHGEVRHPRRRAALGRADRRRQQERGAADPRRLPAHRGGAAPAPGAADPRHRGADRAARAARRRGRLGRPTTACASAPRRSPTSPSTRSSRRRSAPRSCSPGRCWPASARRGCRRRAATSSAAGGSTPTSTPSATSARRSRATAGSSWRRPPGGLRRLRDLHGRALGDGDRERADGGGADPGADDDLQRRLRAARPGPGPSADQDGRRRSTGSAPT